MNKPALKRILKRAAVFFMLLYICAVPISHALENIFGTRVTMGLVQNNDINEASGMAASAKNNGVLWVHNDSGDQNRVFAMSETGRHLGEYFLHGASARDWEDMTIGPGPDPAKSYLYIGDIGDNNAQYAQIQIYRAEEPVVDSSQTPVSGHLSAVDKLSFVYPDGARDAETLMIDPLTRDIYIVSKREANVRLYRAAYPQSVTAVDTLEYLAEINLSLVTAGEISSSGEEILLKTYTHAYYWKRNPGQSIKDALVIAPTQVNYIPEVQGEALCWKPDGNGYYTVSEEAQNVPAVLYFYPRVNPLKIYNDLVPPSDYRLNPCYPNPFNPQTKISFQLPKTDHVKLAVFNQVGEQVEILLDREFPPGLHSANWQPQNLASGVYYVQLSAAGQQWQQQAIYIK